MSVLPFSGRVTRVGCGLRVITSVCLQFLARTTARGGELEGIHFSFSTPHSSSFLKQTRFSWRIKVMRHLTLQKVMSRWIKYSASGRNSRKVLASLHRHRHLLRCNFIAASWGSPGVTDSLSVVGCVAPGFTAMRSFVRKLLALFLLFVYSAAAARAHHRLVTRSWILLSLFIMSWDFSALATVCELFLGSIFVSSWHRYLFR